jgi:hypothetical protein
VTVAGSVDPELVVVISSRRRKEGRKEGGGDRSSFRAPLSFIGNMEKGVYPLATCGASSD